MLGRHGLAEAKGDASLKKEDVSVDSFLKKEENFSFKAKERMVFFNFKESNSLQRLRREDSFLKNEENFSKRKTL